MTTWTMVVELEWEMHGEATPVTAIRHAREALECMLDVLGETAHYHVTQLPRVLGTQKTRGD